MEPTPGDALIQQMQHAQRVLASITVRLHQAQVAALTGQGYNPDELDQLVAAYRTAKAAADQARSAWEQWQHQQHQQQTQPVGLRGRPPAPPVSKSGPNDARLQFAQWLYQHGYIGEGIGEGLRTGNAHADVV